MLHQIMLRSIKIIVREKKKRPKGVEKYDYGDGLEDKCR